MRLTIDLTEEEVKILKKRGKKNFLELKEQVEDIIRRSCITAKTISYPKTKADDALVDIFSRERRGKKTNKKKKFSIKKLLWGEKEKKKKIRFKQSSVKIIKPEVNNANNSIKVIPEAAFRDK